MMFVLFVFFYRELSVPKHETTPVGADVVRVSCASLPARTPSAL